MRFEADLDITVDGTTVHVGSDGATLLVEADDPFALTAALRNSGARRNRRNVIDLAERLADRGVSIEVYGPSGLLVALGAPTNARLLGWVFGTRHIAPGPARALLGLVGSATTNALPRARRGRSGRPQDRRWPTPGATSKDQ